MLPPCLHAPELQKGGNIGVFSCGVSRFAENIRIGSLRFVAGGVSP